MNPYSVLGLNPNASDNEVVKAYKKLAREHHPDKGGSKEKFQEISAAYTTIMKDDPADSFPEIMEIFKMFGLGSFDKMFSSQGINLNTLISGNSPFAPRGPTISATLTLTLEQLEVGGEFEIAYMRSVPTGKMTQTVTQSPFGTVNMITPEVEEREYTVKVNVPPCHDERKALIFNGMATGVNVPPGTLEVHLKISKHETLVRIPGTLDLLTEVDITLKEALTGFEKTVELLGDLPPLKIECESIINPYTTKRIPLHGMRKEGDLVLKFKIQFPVILEASTKEIIKNISDL